MNINKEYTEEFIKENLRDREGILSELEEYAKENHIPIVTPEVAQFLDTIIKIKKPKKVLEIGTAIGYSGIVMLKASDDIKKLTTIEIDQERAKIAENNFLKANVLEKVEIVNDDANSALDKIFDKYDFIFMDAAKGQYINYFEKCKNLLNDGGVVVCDNILFRGMVASDALADKRNKTIVKRLRTFVKEMTNSCEFYSSLLPLGDGILLVVRG